MKRLIKDIVVFAVLTGAFLLMKYPLLHAMLFSSSVYIFGLLSSVKLRSLPSPISQDGILLTSFFIVALYLTITIAHCALYSGNAFSLNGGNKHVLNPVLIIGGLLCISFDPQILQKRVNFVSNRKKISLPISDIAYVESNDKFVQVVDLKGNVYKNYIGIEKWQERLPKGFLRTHRSYLVNSDYISAIDEDSVKMSFVKPLPSSIPLSRKYRSTIMLSFPDKCVKKAA